MIDQEKWFESCSFVQLEPPGSFPWYAAGDAYGYYDGMFMILILSEKIFEACSFM